jgi:hypothetical protein
MTTNKILIQKASGEKEVFDTKKLLGSLKRSGASEENADMVVSEILSKLYEGITTREIYNSAFKILRSLKNSNAARYSLKNAIMQLGPTGHPFEYFIGEVFASQGFKVEVGQVIKGRCVTHEVDVIATKNNTQYLVECKFYNSHGKYANVQVPLYIKSRVDDIVAYRKNLAEFKDTNFQGWVVTNTRFTDDALSYGQCIGLNMMGWDIPQKKSLKELVEQENLFPITVLTNLTKKDKAILLGKGIVLCRHIFKNPKVLDHLFIKENKKAQILKEIKELVKS